MTHPTPKDWRTIFEEIDIDYTEYTPDKGMPSPIYHVNDAQMDYVCTQLLSHAQEEERARIVGRLEGRKWVWEEIDGETYIHRKDNYASATHDSYATTENLILDQAIDIVKDNK